MTVSIAVLPERAVVKVDGAEARDFLQSLLTCDVEPLYAGQAAYGALLTPQGKILFDLFCVATDAGFLLDVAASTAEEFVKRLTMYRLRRKLAIELEPGLGIAAIWGSDVPPRFDAGLMFRDPRTPGLGYRAIGETAKLAAAATVDAARYHEHRIGSAIADSDRDIGSGQLFPHEANLDQLHGVSFTKGCYIGQEVVSRMEHRGTARSRIVPVRFVGPQPMPGTEVAAGGRGLGRILSGIDGRGLALLRLDRAEAATGASEPLVAGDTTIAVERADWARFRVPGKIDAAGDA